MYLPAEVVLNALKVFTDAELHCSVKEPVAGVRLHGSAVEPGYAYVIRGEDATNPDDLRTLICVGEPACVPARYIQVPENTDLLQIVNELQEVFVRFPALDAQLARAALEDGYDNLLQEAADILGNSVTLADNNNRLRAAVSYSRKIPDQPGSFTSLRELRRHGDLDLISDLTEPTEFKFPYFDAPCIITNLFLEGKPVGRLIVICHLKPPNARDRFICSLIATYLQHKISRDEAFGYIRADDPLYSMFYDLLTGMRLASELITGRLSELPGWEQGAYRVLAIPLEDDAVSFTYYSSELSKQFDSYSVLVGETLLCVLHEHDQRAAWSSLEHRIDTFLESCEQRGGLSNVFTRIEELHERSQQAQTALRFSPNERLGIYTTKMLMHIMTFFPKEQRHLLVHPAIFRLRDVDRAQGTEYVETLRVYLQTERSLSATAAKLFIHRNTLLYRLEKLRNVIYLDLDDPTLRLHLLLSFEIMNSYSTE